MRAAVDDARNLADHEDAAPAAVFFAFARRPRAFPGAWRLMPALLVLNQARSTSRRLDTNAEELNSLLLAVAKREIEFDDVLSWFRERMHDR